MNEPHQPPPPVSSDPPPTGDFMPPSIADEVVEILDRYAAELKEGRQPDREALLRAHPHLARQLESCLPGLEFIHRADQAVRAGKPATRTPVDPTQFGVGGQVAGLPAAGQVAGLPAAGQGQTIRLGDFLIHREIGHGGMGTVYDATQVSLGRRVALKVLRFSSVSDPEALQRFQREAETVARLHHTNIVPIFTVGNDGGVNYYAMQFIEGQSLADLAKSRGGPLDPMDAARYGLEAAEALAHAHHRGVIHRDVKPSNLLLDQEGRIWLTDFGLARRQDDVTLSVAGALLGTPRYMSPEQAASSQKRLDHRTDIYSLGATLYELATGRPVFAAQSPHEVITQILTIDPATPRSVRPDVPRDLETILVKCLAKDPTGRYDSAQELADDLRAFLDGRPIRARRATPVERLVHWYRRQRRSVTTALSAAAVSLGLVVAGGIVAYSWSQWRLGRVQLQTEGLPLVAEILDENRTRHAAVTVPTHEPLEAPSGSYTLKVTGESRLSQEYLAELDRGQLASLDVGLDDQLMGFPLEIPGSYVPIDFPEGTQLIELDETGLTKREMTHGWKSSSLAIKGATEELLKNVKGLQWPWSRSSYSGYDKFDNRPHVVSPAVDVNGDGVADLIVAAQHQAWLMALSGDTLKPLWFADRRTEEQITADAVSPTLFHRLESCVAAPPWTTEDIDGDGARDVMCVLASVAPTYTPDRFQKAQRWLEAVSGKTGVTIWRRDLPADWFAHETVLEPPYAFRFFVGQGSGWSRSGGGAISMSYPYPSRYQRGEVDRGGDAMWLPDRPRELVVGERKVHALVAGTRLVGIDQKTGELATEINLDRVPAWPVRWGDLDGDGLPEAVLMEEDPARPQIGAHTLRLSAWSWASQSRIWETTVTARWPRSPDWHVAAPAWPLIEDLDGDGAAEVIVPTGGTVGAGPNFIAPPTGTLAVLDGKSGQTRWTARIRNIDDQVDHFCVGPDIDGDGARDLFVQSLWGTPQSLYVDALSGLDGQVLWTSEASLSRSSESTASFNLAPPVWRRLGSSAQRQLIAHVLASNPGQGDDTLVLFDPQDGRIAGSTSRTREYTLWDVDRDGVDELLLFRPASSSRDQGGRLAVVRGVSDEPWRRAGGQWRVVHDLDGDGTRDLVEVSASNAVRAQSGATGRLLWTGDTELMYGQLDKLVSLGQSAYDRISPTGRVLDPPLADMDGDGVGDLLMSHQFAGPVSPLCIVISGRTGRTLWRSPIEVSSVRALMAVETVDLEKDGAPEIVLVTGADIDYPRGPVWSTNEGQLWVVVHDGRTGKLRWKQPLGVAYQGLGAGPTYRMEQVVLGVPFAHFDDDNILDLVVPAETSSDGTRIELRALSGRDGAKLWSQPRKGGDPNSHDLLTNLAPYVAEDLDQNGRPELLHLEFDRKRDAPNGGALARLVCLDHLGAERWRYETQSAVGWGYVNWEERSIAKRPRPHVVRSSSGQPLVVLLTGNHPLSQLVTLDATGKPVSTLELPWDGYSSRIMVSDLDGDADDELVIYTGGELVARDPERLSETLWKSERIIPQLPVDLLTILPARPAGVTALDQPPMPAEPATIFVQGQSGNPTVMGISGQTGQPLWSCPAPAPRSGIAWVSIDRSAVLSTGREVNTSPLVHFRYGQISLARAAVPVATKAGSDALDPLVRAPTSSGEGNIAPAPAKRDSRYRRRLPWISPFGRVQFLPNYLLAAVYSITLVWIPAWCLWRMVTRRQWGMRTMLALPAVAGLAFAVLLVQVPDYRTASQKFGAGLVAFPILFTVSSLAVWIVTGRIRRVLILVAVAIGFAVLMAMFALFVSKFDQQAITQDEYYSWDGWWHILVPSGFAVSCGYAAFAGIARLAAPFMKRKSSPVSAKKAGRG